MGSDGFGKNRSGNHLLDAKLVFGIFSEMGIRQVLQSIECAEIEMTNIHIDNVFISSQLNGNSCFY